MGRNFYFLISFIKLGIEICIWLWYYLSINYIWGGVMSKLQNYLSSIEMLGASCREIDKKRALARKQYEATLLELGAEEAGLERQIREMGDKVVSARLVDFVEHLAEEWGTTAENINIGMYSNCRNFVSSEDEFRAQVGEKLSQDSLKVYYYLTRKNLDPVSSANQSITLEQRIRDNSYMADGKHFVDHMVVQHGDPKGARSHMMDVGVDNIEDILIYTKLKKLIFYANQNPQTMVCSSPDVKAMISAVEDYESETEKEIDD